jgi:hypothetical protein
MDQVQVDGKAFEGLQTRFAVSRECLPAAIWNPPSPGSSHAALGNDACSPAAVDNLQRSGQQAFVVPQLGWLWRVSVRGVEDAHTGADGCCDGLNRKLLIGR